MVGPMHQPTEVVVIGAGVVGLACARALAQKGHSVTIIERHSAIGQETSSRNSEVIHAGLYYPRGSLKTRSCVEGRELLYAYCRSRGVAHRQTGKLIVAADTTQARELEALYARGLENEVGPLRLLDDAEARALEPEVKCALGLLSPRTGIVDSHDLLEHFKRDALENHAAIAFRTHVVGTEHTSRWRVDTTNDRHERQSIDADWVVNAAGLDSDRVASLCGVDVVARRLRLHPCKGDYFVLSPRFRNRVRHLVYPLPVQAGLGIHITLDLDGHLRAGPDTEYVTAPRYDVDPNKATKFALALARYLPGIHSEDLSPGYAGVRPKLAGPGEGFRDFVCEVFPEAPRAVHLVGIESPGLTAALSLAAQVVARIESE